MKKGVAVILAFLTAHVYAQDLYFSNLHYRNHFLFDSLSLSQQNHSSIKPQLKTFGTTNDYKVVAKVAKNALLYPIVDLGLGYDYTTNLSYTTGLGLGFDYSRSKLVVTGKVLPYFRQGGYVVDSIQNISHIDIGTGRPLSGNIFLQGELLAAYNANKFFTFIGGIGKNFFGEGYRSLLLSDNAAASPFVKMETTFWTIKYVSLINMWNDFYNEPTNRSKDITKLSASHYLSWNITKAINFSVFESVVWQAKDSLTNRYFEPNYMNPFVLYRPVEYAQGSADNVLIGTNISFKPTNKITTYAQLILDEFYLVEIRARNKWWANKFGVQTGIKIKDLIVSNLYGQLEFNMVRPYTFSHKQSPQSYSHANASVTHPLGSNFFELTGILSYQKNQHQLTGLFSYSMFGTDTSDISYGQNIFQSYSNRPGNYNHTIGQGLQHNVFSANLFYERALNISPNLYLTARIQLIFNQTPNNSFSNQSFEFGFRSRIWNRYDDY
ncbi:MAG: hypothetical protein R3279_08800 [Putridiphycobacter sp.]|nr:hypothetical protein [Putridiphycobacter sp.]